MNNYINFENSDKDKRVIVFYDNNSFIYFFLNNDRLYSVYREAENELKLNDIIVCKVDKKKKELEGHFVKLSSDVNGLLLQEDAKDITFKTGDEILVQIKKEALNNKNENKVARVSTNLEIAGEHCIVTNLNNHSKDEIQVNYSKKLSKDFKNDFDEFLSKKFLFEKFVDYSLTIRTSAKDIDFERLYDDIVKSVNKLQTIITKGKYATCYSILNRNSYIDNLISNNGGIDDFKIIANDQKSYDFLLTSMKEDFVKKLSLYDDSNISLISLYGLKNKFENIVNEKVWLKNGGYIFITKTPAFYVIDVNLGKANYKGSKEEINLKANIDAVNEIAYQIEARNLSGIIIIDFINMKEDKSKTILIDVLKNMFSKIKTPPKVVDITKLGLVEITREKKYNSIYEISNVINKTILR